MNQDNIIDWQNPPIANEQLPFKFPDFQRRSLNQKFELFTYNDSSQPLVYLKLIFDRGSYGETHTGISKVAFDSLLSGAGGLSHYEFSAETDYLGASISTSCSKDESSVSLNCLTENFEAAFEYFSMMILNPNFDSDEIKKSIRKLISAKEQSESDPYYLSSVGLNSSIFRNTGFEYPKYGLSEEIDKIDPNDITTRYQNILRNSRISIVASGDLSNINLESKINTLISSFKDKFEEEEIESFYDDRTENKIILVDYQDSKQTILNIGKFSVDIADSFYPGAKLINVITGGYFQSRLNNLLREKKGLTYGVHSNLSTKVNVGIFNIKTAINTASVFESVDDIINELSEISNMMIEEEELNRARNYMLGTFLRSTENYKQIAGALSTMASYNLENDHFDNFYNSIKEIKSDELFSVQIDYFRPEGLNICMVGDIKKLRPLAEENFDRVEILDPEGKLLERIDNNNE